MVVKASISELNKASAQDVWSRGEIVIEALTKNVAAWLRLAGDRMPRSRTSRTDQTFIAFQNFPEGVRVPR